MARIGLPSTKAIVTTIALALVAIYISNKVEPIRKIVYG